MINCQKCKAEVKPPSDSFTLIPCKHVYCHQCLCQYVTNNILQSYCKIKCPTSSCQTYISDMIIRKCLSSDGTNVYDQLSISASLFNNNQKLLAVKCLTKNCPKMVIIDNVNVNFHCNYCDQPNCLKCKKRHFPSDCGKGNLNEAAINASAEKMMKQHVRDALENQFKNEKFIPNPDGFECTICYLFILPREGTITRNCNHSFCKACFINTIETIEFIDQMKCPVCETDLNERDIIGAIGENKLFSLGFSKARPKFFACKFPDCTGLWDHCEFKGSYTCNICNHINCLECQDWHEGMSCTNFRLSSRYKNYQAGLKSTAGQRRVKCSCGRLLIQKGGCGALYCDNCGNQVCIFTGKKAGLPGPDGCGCTVQKTCHKDCKYGCFPDQHKSVKCTCGKILNHRVGSGDLICDNCGSKVCIFTGKKSGLPAPNGCGCTTKNRCHKDCRYGC